MNWTDELNNYLRARYDAMSDRARTLMFGGEYGWVKLEYAKAIWTQQFFWKKLKELEEVSNGRRDSNEDHS